MQSAFVPPLDQASARAAIFGDRYPNGQLIRSDSARVKPDAILDFFGTFHLTGRKRKLMQTAFTGGGIHGGDPKTLIVEIDSLHVVCVALQFNRVDKLE